MIEIVYFLIISAPDFCTTKRQECFKHREELLYVRMYLRTCRLCRPVCRSVNIVSSPLDFHFFFLDSILPPFKILHPSVEVKEEKKSIRRENIFFYRTSSDVRSMASQSFI